MAYDPSTKSMVLFGGSTSSSSADGQNDTWTWSGSAWTSVQAASASAGSSTQPSARALAAMAYDEKNHQLVLFGGLDTAGNRLGDTWVWGGSSWTQVASAGSGAPAIRSGAMLAWDGATGQLVLFGGYGADGSGSYQNDTWVWSGTAWSSQSVSTPPPARSQGTLTYSPASGQLVLFGGQQGGQTALNDTWLWTGSTWQQSSATAPAARTAQAGAFDPYLGRIVLFGGCGTSCDSSRAYDTWSWSGTGWRQETPSAAPTTSGRWGASAAFDPRSGKLVLFGGYTSSTQGDTWLYGPDPGTPPDWRKAASTGPSGRAGSATAFDGATGQLLLFGGYNGASGGTLLGDTWSWDGSAWTNVTPAGGSPSARRNATMVYDPGTGQLLLFGGSDASGYRNDTWVWTFSGGSGTWTQLSPATSPPARSAASAGWDAKLGQLILVSGQNGSGAISDQWQWSGTTWSQVGSGLGPNGRIATALVYNPATAQMVLQGGWSSIYQYTGTFVRNADGSFPANSSATGLGATASGTAQDFDPVLGAQVIWDSLNRVTYTFDGTNWSTLSTAHAPPGWSGNGSTPVGGDTRAVFDPATGQLVVFGGWTSTSSYATDTWVLEYAAQLTAPSAAAAAATSTLTGYDQTVAASHTLEVDDPSTAGWNVTVSADQLPTSTSGALPALRLTSGAATSATESSAIAPTCVSGSCTAASTGTSVAYPLTVPAGSATTLYSAAGGSGVGRIGLPVKFWSTVPANAKAGSYTSTLTVTISSGP